MEALYIVLALCLLFTLAACGGGGEKETTEANKTLLLLANMKKMILSRAFVIFLFSTLILSCLYFLFFDRQAVRSYKKKQER